MRTYLITRYGIFSLVFESLELYFRSSGTWEVLRCSTN